MHGARFGAHVGAGTTEDTVDAGKEVELGSIVDTNTAIVVDDTTISTVVTTLEVASED